MRLALPLLAIAGVAIASVLALPGDARAHPLGFAVVSIRETTPGHADVLVRVSGTESDPGRIGLRWPEDCAESVLRDAMRDEVRERRSRLTCSAGLAGATLGVEGPARGLEVLVDTRLSGRAPSRRAVRALPAEVALGRAGETGEIVSAHVRLGAQHFALGIDHLLFVLGAFFLARRRGARAVAVAVTAFTLGHALTLAAATLGGATLPSRPVEACIALSLVHVAREVRVERDTLTRRAPALACLLFGLVHGAGLAGAMADAGLAGPDLGLAVLSFNVGLELAELALVLALFALVRGVLAAPAERILPWMVGGVGAWLLLGRLL